MKYIIQAARLVTTSANQAGGCTITVGRFEEAELILTLAPGSRIILSPGSVIQIVGPPVHENSDSERVIAENVSLRDRRWNEA